MYVLVAKTSKACVVRVSWQVNVGGLSTGAARPLVGELNKFADSAANGLIVVAFGSLDVGSDRFFDELFTSFSHLDEFHVVWR